MILQANPTKYTNAVYLDKDILLDTELSPMDIRVYATYASLTVGSEFNDLEITLMLGRDTRYAVRKSRKKLIQKDLIRVVDITQKEKLLFVGNTEKPASKLVREWRKKVQKDINNPALSRDDLEAYA